MTTASTARQMAIDYVRAAHLWNDKGMTTQQISDAMGWTKRSAERPYSKAYHVMQSLREGVTISGKIYRIQERNRRPISTDVTLRIWARERSGKISIVLRGPSFMSTVRDDSGKRGHKHLFGKLKKFLQSQGKWPE